MIERLVDIEALAVVQFDERQRSVDQQQECDQALPSVGLWIDPVTLDVAGEQ